MRRVLIDTGPLVAWFDRNDPHHRAVSNWLQSFTGELLSTWPVLTETCHLLPESMVPAFLRWIADGGLSVQELPPGAIPSIANRMDKYADLPMDLADASLLWIAEQSGVLDILTLDERDFGVYRTARGKSLRNLLFVKRISEPRKRYTVKRG